MKRVQRRFNCSVLLKRGVSAVAERYFLKSSTTSIVTSNIDGMRVATISASCTILQIADMKLTKILAKQQ
jgi:hypothetical protein